MPCPLCSHDKTYKHGKTSKGSQRYRCLNCKQTFTSTFDTIYYRRQVSFEEVRIVFSHTAKEPVCVGLVGLVDCLTPRESA
jgi:transposase-like protein